MDEVMRRESVTGNCSVCTSLHVELMRMALRTTDHLVQICWCKVISLPALHGLLAILIYTLFTLFIHTGIHNNCKCAYLCYFCTSYQAICVHGYCSLCINAVLTSTYSTSKDIIIYIHITWALAKCATNCI